MGRKFIIAGGGTGGHIFPAIAIANALKELDPETDILFIGAKGKMEMEKVPQAGYPIEGLDIAGFNRSSLMKNAALPYKLLKSFLQVRTIFKRFKPDAVIGVGGYSSFPVLRFAQARRIPTFLHESNSFAGRSNILLGKKATRIFVATEGMEKFFPAGRISVTGNPVRPVIVKVPQLDKQQAAHFFGLNGTRKTLFVVGGSLGARSINEAIGHGLKSLVDAGLQVIWQTGKTASEQWRAMAAPLPNVKVSEFIVQMENAYAAADIVVSRAGAMAIAELCVAQKPSLFVPYPHAAEDHQTANAQDLVKKGAAVMVKDSDAANELVPAILKLAGDQKKQDELKEHIGRYGVADADQQIAKEILKTIGS